MTSTQEKFHDRKHGDGNLNLEPSVESDERNSYFQILQEILSAVNLNFDLTDNIKVDNALLAIKQRLALGFSNGCPWPEKETVKFIKKQEDEILDLDKLAELVLESGRSDAQCNVLYQEILKYANQTLRSELQLLKVAEKLDGQENENLPEERVVPINVKSKNKILVAGMAYDPVYVDILVPLQELIVGAEDQQIAYNKVLKFIIKESYESDDIEKLIEKTKKFLE